MNKIINPILLATLALFAGACSPKEDMSRQPNYAQIEMTEAPSRISKAEAFKSMSDIFEGTEIDSNVDGLLSPKERRESGILRSNRKITPNAETYSFKIEYSCPRPSLAERIADLYADEALRMQETMYKKNNAESIRLDMSKNVERGERISELLKEKLAISARYENAHPSVYETEDYKINMARIKNMDKELEELQASFAKSSDNVDDLLKNIGKNKTDTPFTQTVRARRAEQQ